MAAIDMIVTRFVQQNVGGLRRDLAFITGDMLRLESNIQRTGNVAARIVGVSAIAMGAIVSVTRASLRSYGEVERVQTGFMTVLRDGAKTQALLQKVRDFDVKTPFSYLDTARASQVLLAAGFRDVGASQGGLIPTMYAIGNATIAAGKGTDTFVRALNIMAKIKTSGTLTGIRINQFASAGINLKSILKKQLGLTDDQMINIGRLHLKADVVIPAIIKGLNEQFGGAIDKAGKTYLGSLEILKGSEEKLLASIGKTISPDATKFVRSVTEMVNSIEHFISVHPRFVSAALRTGAVASLAGVMYGVYKSFQFASLGRRAFVKVIESDIAAERTKTGVAIGEKAALAGVGTQVAATATKLNILQRAALWFRSPAFGMAGSASVIPAMSGRYVFDEKLLRFRDTMNNGKMASNATVAAWDAKIAEEEARLAAIRSNIFNISKGRALGGAAIGVAAGYGAYDDYSTLGYGGSESAVAGGATGVAAAIASMFLPGAAVPIALATGFRYVFNELVNRPMEREAEQGNGLSPEETAGQKGKTRRQRADAYFKKANELDEQSKALLDKNPLTISTDDIYKGRLLKVEAANAREQGMIMVATAKKEEAAAAKKASDQKMQDSVTEARREDDIKRAEYFKNTQDPSMINPIRYNEDDSLRGSRLVSTKSMGGSEKRDGTTTMTIQHTVQIPQRQADRDSRKRHYKALSVQPSLR